MTRVIGLAGPPGAGKSTLAARMADAVAGSAVVLPMDGFHFRNAELERRGLAVRKGAPDTFDVDGLVALLARVREPGRRALTAPAYSREAHEPVADAIVIPASATVVIVEGNYLGLSGGGWERVRPLLDELWFLDVPWEVTRERLIARRVDTGRSAPEAVSWVDTVDKANDRAIRATASAADRVLTDGEAPPLL
ncbi:nucleoside/nucleotide kinase family protein [Demequina sp. NBRC 110051]|uniref:nucleoside/nucleotide kinase family protein n=1 Tax=Demequina sp. NBRC 110051 TaxID=1570340 RepID=UPI00190EAE20|nr:nucleoside/nucleotide kinase family protein [Demequina sp. NBRC 110051]